MSSFYLEPSSKCIRLNAWKALQRNTGKGNKQEMGNLLLAALEFGAGQRGVHASSSCTSQTESEITVNLS